MCLGPRWAASGRARGRAMLVVVNHGRVDGVYVTTAASVVLGSHRPTSCMLPPMLNLCHTLVDGKAE